MPGSSNRWGTALDVEPEVEFIPTNYCLVYDSATIADHAIRTSALVSMELVTPQFVGDAILLPRFVAYRLRRQRVNATRFLTHTLGRHRRGA